jgi:hypothetical protein
MLRVQNQIKQDVSSGLPLAVGVVRGDLQVTLSPDQKKSQHPGPCAGTSREHVTKWDVQI